MADLTCAISFTKSTADFIEQLESSGFSNHTLWGSEEFQPIRSEVREFYRLEQRGKCAFCKQIISVQSALNCQVEHIVPKALHVEFIFTPKNLCVICADCNEIKREQETLGSIPETLVKGAARKLYPRSSSSFLIVHPHFDNYNDHILIVNGLYVDKGSKKGNFTIGACRLNRKLAVFGWDLDVVDDQVLVEEMNKFINEKSTAKRARHLSTIKNHLFNI